MMPWFATKAKITNPIATTIPILMYFPESVGFSGGFSVSCLGLLYKTSFVVNVVN
jgi:hypothetical protein